MRSVGTFRRRANGYSGTEEEHSHEDLRSLLALSSHWLRSKFLCCKLGMSSFQGGSLKETSFSDCQMYGVNLQLVELSDVTFEDCNLEHASFAGSQLTRVSFVDCELGFSSFAGCLFRQKVTFRGCNMRGVDLCVTEADPRSVAMDSCDLWSAKVAIGCQMFNQSFDEELARQLVSLVARVYPDPGLMKFAGETYGRVDRLVRGGD